MSLPNYFRQSDDLYFYSVGDRIYGSIEVDLSPELPVAIVTYRFNDGEKPYSSQCACNTNKQGERLAAKFAALMRRYNGENTIPTISVFENMATGFGTLC